MFDEFIEQIRAKVITLSGGNPEIEAGREITPPEGREVKPSKPISDAMSCPYCNSKAFVKRGWRQKERERVQLYQCKDCDKTFTPRITKGKHYPLATILEAMSFYNLGYSLEEACRRVNQTETQKTPITRGSCDSTKVGLVRTCHSTNSLAENNNGVKSVVEVTGFAPAESGMTSPTPHCSTPTQDQVLHTGLQPSTLSAWLREFEDVSRFGHMMRQYAVKMYKPSQMVATATLAHRQLYRYRFHRAKCDLLIRGDYKHRNFGPLKEFLDLVPTDCPHQHFVDGKNAGLRASEAPLTFSREAMIVRGKTNLANALCAFVLQSVGERKDRHNAIQKFMLYNDTVTVATEVPVYITRDDIEHLKTQLGFEIYRSAAGIARPSGSESLPTEIAKDLPKLITGHIDLVQIRNGSIHLLDYKPNAAKEQPIDQLTIYAMAMSRLTGLRLFDFKCAWFDEEDYFEFFPLHVLHKPKKALRRRKVITKEGVYAVNRQSEKVASVRPL